MFKDQLTPMERSRLLGLGKDVDRLPCNPNIANGVARIYGCKISDFNTDPKVIAKSQMYSYKTFGSDSLRVFTDLFIYAEAMGAKLVKPEDNTADLLESVIKDIEDIDKLEPVDPFKDGRLPVQIEAMKYLKEYSNNEVPCSTGIIGPFTNAFFLYGVDETLRLLYKNPEAMHKLCRVSLETAKRHCKAAIDIGLSPAISEPMSSSTVVSPKIFREFSLPYLQELVLYIKSLGSNAVIHICGQTDLIWEDIAGLDIAGFSIDNVASLVKCKEKIGSRVKLLGNVDPASALYLGTENYVKEKTLECILDGYDSPKGYVVMSGCSLPIETPKKNIQAMMDVVREVGYPINPSKVQELIEKYKKLNK